MEEAIANLNAITMPETFGDFEIILPSDISTEFLPEAEPDLLNLNVARRESITSFPSPLESPRGGSLNELPLEPTVGESTGFGDWEDIDIITRLAKEAEEASKTISVGAPSISEPTDIIQPPEELEPPVITHPEELPPEGPPLPPEPELVPPELEPPQPMKSVDSSTSVSENLAIEGMAELTPAARLRNKRYKVDRRIELSESVMSKTVKDTSSLLRPLERAPPTKELMRLRQIEIETGPVAFFNTPNDANLAPELSKLIQRTMCKRDQLKIPLAKEEEESIQKPLEDKRQKQVPPEEPIELAPMTVEPAPEFPPDTSVPEIPTTTFTDQPEEGPSISLPEIVPPDISVPTVPSKEQESEVEERTLIITQRTQSVYKALSVNFNTNGDQPISLKTWMLPKSREIGRAHV